MNRKLLSKVINSAGEIVTLATAFLLPLYFSFFYQKLPNFLIYIAVDRLSVIKIGVLILSLLTFFKLLLDRNLSIGLTLKQAYFFIPVVIAAIISAIISIDRHTSFWGSYYRQQGLTTNLLYWIFFLLLLIQLDTRKKLERLITVVLAASFLVSLFGILEWLGINLLLRSSSAVPFGRVSSSLGQPVFLGNYLLLTIFLGWYKLVASKKLLARAWWLLVIAAQFACLIFTYTRGAWLGFIAGSFFGINYGAYYLNSRKPGLFRWIVLAGAAVFILLVALSFAILPRVKLSVTTSSPLVSRFTSIFNYSLGSNALRYKYWQTAIRAIAARPILGYGLETQRLLYVSYYDREDLLYERLGSIVDRAHNQYLDVLLQTGLLGSLAYGLVYLYLLRSSLLFLKDSANDRSDRWLVFWLLVGLISILTALFFSFTVIEVNTYLYIYVAALLLLLNHFSRATLLDIKDLRRGFYFIFIYAGIIFTILVYLAGSNQADRIRADYHFALAKNQIRGRFYVEAMNNYLLAITLNPQEEVYRDAFLIDAASINITKLTRSGADGEREVDPTEFLTDIIRLDDGLSSNFFREYRRAIYLVGIAKDGESPELGEADAIYQSLIQMNPNLPDLYKTRSMLYAKKSDFGLAVSTLSRVFKVVPDINDPRLNQVYRTELSLYLAGISELLASYYCQDGKQTECAQNYLVALRFNPTQSVNRARLSEQYRMQGQLEPAIEQLVRAERQEPGNWQWHYALAQLLFEKKAVAAALTETERAGQLSPDNQAVAELESKIRGEFSKERKN